MSFLGMKNNVQSFDFDRKPEIEPEVCSGRHQLSQTKRKNELMAITALRKQTLCRFIFEFRQTQNLTDTFRDTLEFCKTILLVNNLVTQPQKYLAGKVFFK